jgi:hypothetical protein
VSQIMSSLPTMTGHHRRGRAGPKSANRRHHSMILSSLESGMPSTSTTSAFAVVKEILFVSRLRAMQ